jgi:serine/threonine-protein kinase
MTFPDAAGPSAASHQRWLEIKETATDVLELPSEERAAYLKTACGEDDALRDSVERLVQACERAANMAGFLGEPAAAFAAPMLAAMRAGDSRDGSSVARTALGGEVAERLTSALRLALAERYTVEREVGRGGMASVFAAHDLRHDRRVAIKVLQPELGMSLSGERFLREIRVTAGLTHPHILPLHDSGEAAGLLYYVMPFVEGESLRQRLARDRQLPVDVIVRIAREVASALAYAHRRGIVHRDIKPENILLSDDHAIVADFGIARALRQARATTEREADPTATLTGAGMSLGTPAYMAPEQALGDKATDHRADLYALGVVAYEALAGTHPFGHRTAVAMIAAHLTERPAPLLDTRPDVPDGLAQLVMQLLAKDPATRPPTADAVLQGLDEISTTSNVRERAARARPAVPAKRWHPTAIGLGILLMLASLGGYGWLRRRGGAPVVVGATNAASALAPSLRGAAPSSSVAVLPFSNSGGDSASESFAFGLTDELIDALGRVAGLKVAGRTSVFALSGRKLDVHTIGDTLGVRTVLEGSVRQSGQRLKVSARLVSAADNAVLWTSSYDRELKDVFAVQEEIARAIVGALSTQLAANSANVPLVDHSTSDMGAYELYLQGRFNLNKRSREGLQRAIGFFQRAIEQDPKYALAYVGLSDAYVNMSNFDFMSSAEALPRARAAAERAVAMDDHLAAAQASYGFVLAAQRVFAPADSAFRRAIALQPSYVWAHHFYSMLLIVVGRPSQAIEENRLALESDRLAPPANAQRGVLYCMAGDYESARRQLQRTLVLAPGFQLALYYLGLTEAADGRYDEAIAALQQARQRSPGFPGVSAALVYVYRRSGRQQEADAIQSELNATPDSPRARINQGLAHAVVGELDQAFAVLDRVEWDVPSLIELRVDPLLGAMRSDVRFSRLLASLHLPL